VETSDDLFSALAVNGRHKQLTSLDLTHTPCIHKSIADGILQALCKALPNLRILRLPDPYHAACQLTAAAIAAATAQLPQLTALHVPSLSRDDDNPVPEWPIQGCAHIQELALPRALAVRHTTPLACSTTLSKLCFLASCPGGNCIDMAHIAALAAQLPALVALELAGCFKAAPQLEHLAQLTALKLSGRLEGPGGVTTGQLLHLVGTLTNLRSLVLKLAWTEGDPAQPGWLARLTLLTNLQVDFGSSDCLVRQRYNEQELVYEDVASSVALLPALSELHITAMGIRGITLSAACMRIASAGSSLRLLHMERLTLPAGMFPQVLPQLTGLTCVRSINNRTPPSSPSAGSVW
jgi:hypothetical protein